MRSESQVTPRARTLEAGAQLGRYTIVRRIGAGGMAELYLARARGIGRFDKLFALKLVLPHVADDPEFVAMFLDEARLAATLDHANIVHVVDIGRTGGDHFYAMEYIHGLDLRALLRGTGMRLPIEVALTIVLGIAAGLHHAHERTGLDGSPLGIVHRDVSPSNVIVTYDGVVKLVDFGIARAEARSKVTQAGVVKGKRGYMSPEQCRGDAVDRRSDVFGLGILLWELTVGVRLFAAENDYAVMSKVVFGLVDDPRTVVPDYPAELAEITMRALQRDPALRPATARDLAVELERFAQRAGLRTSNHLLAEFIAGYFAIEPYPTSPAMADPLDGPSTRTIATRRRRSVRRAAIGLAAASLLIAGGGVAWAKWGDAVPDAASVVASADVEMPVEQAPSVERAAPPLEVDEEPAIVVEDDDDEPVIAVNADAADAVAANAVAPDAASAAGEQPTTTRDGRRAAVRKPTRPPAAASPTPASPPPPATPPATPSIPPSKPPASGSSKAPPSKGAPVPTRPNVLFPPTE